MASPSWDRGTRERAEVDVGERVAGDHEEGVAEEPGRVAHAARGPQQLLLVAVGELEAEGEPSPKCSSIVSGNQCRLAITSPKPCRRAAARMCSITGRLSTGTIGFGIS